MSREHVVGTRFKVGTEAVAGEVAYDKKITIITDLAALELNPILTNTRNKRKKIKNIESQLVFSQWRYRSRLSVVLLIE